MLAAMEAAIQRWQRVPNSDLIVLGRGLLKQYEPATYKATTLYIPISHVTVGPGATQQHFIKFLKAEDPCPYRLSNRSTGQLPVARTCYYSMIDNTKDSNDPA